MDALEMIREGFAASVAVIPGNLTDFDPAIVVLLILAGVAFAAVVQHFPSRRRPEPMPTTPEVRKPDFNLTRIFELAPFPIWANPDAATPLANEAFRAISGDLGDAFDGSRHSIQIDGKQHWLSVIESEIDGASVKFGFPSDDLIEAENSLKRLMETLSTTFAHLPVGIAVFDADKVLNLFNPALSDLLDLDPTWLAMRPKISTILDKMRDHHQLPEQKDFLAWRRLLSQMDNTTSKNYEDEWNLANGQVLRVSGQSHSKGATSFLFENITTEVHIARQRHADAALNQAVLDHVSDAVIALDAAGQGSFSNAAFDRIFNRKCDDSGKLFDLGALKNMLPGAPEAAKFITKMHTYISESGARTPWSALVSAGDNMTATVFPMPDGSTFVSFTSPEERANQNALHSMMQFATALLFTSNESTSMSDPLNLNGLADFLGARHISLGLDAFSQIAAARATHVKTRRILWYLVLAASNVCRDGGKIELVSNAGERSVRVSCAINAEDILSGQNNHLSLNLLRQLVDQAGGGADWVFDDSARPLTVSCVLPLDDVEVESSLSFAKA